MTSYVRKLVSKNRRRFKEDGFDLDLSYITPNIVAMGFPAGTFLETIYRNDIKTTASMLTQKHGDNYMIFNLSERQISTEIFQERVVDCGWPDHHSPPLDTLVRPSIKEQIFFTKNVFILTLKLVLPVSFLLVYIIRYYSGRCAIQFILG